MHAQIRRIGVAAAAAGAMWCGLVAPAAQAQLSVPVFAREVPAGVGTVAAEPAAFDPRRIVDGKTADWRGTPSGFGGTVVRSSGELIYQDHIFDAYGPDNGQDKQRLAIFDPLAELIPETYRLDPTVQYVPGEFGIPTPGIPLNTHYGDLEHQDQADMLELRAGTDRGGDLWLLARTTTMTTSAGTALLVLVDTTPDAGQPRAVGFNSAVNTRRADRALLLIGNRGWTADLASGAVSELPAGSVATNPSGYTNAIEAKIAPAALGGALPPTASITAATGIADPGGGAKLKNLGLGANLANVAFRTSEPVRNWFDKQQAFALFDRTIDAFFQPLGIEQMRAGVSQRYVPGAGYHDRLFASAPAISQERGEEGVTQHYGVYLPTSYRADRTSPLQMWFHFRGGSAHVAAAVAPRIFKEMGEDRQSIVVSPRGRGTSTWYVGKGQVDYQEVWADAHRTFNIDRNRTYVAGHSMGGWASYLLPILQPDRYAAAYPASGPPTQGGYLGVDFPGCDAIGRSQLCFISANDSEPRNEYTGPLLDNVRWVPYAIYQGVPDELVPTPGVIRQAQILKNLGYRYRLYLFPAEEHYGPPIFDQWTEGARYEHDFTRDPNPPRVTYIRSMAFERAVEKVNSGGVRLNFTFNKAYWMSGLEPVDPLKGVARFDGRSLAIAQRSYGLEGELGGPATLEDTGPYVMTGQTWRFGGAAKNVGNEFEATLSGASAVTLNLKRMSLSTGEPLTGRVDTDAPLTLTLAGAFARGVQATVDGHPLAIRRAAHSATVQVPKGRHVIGFTP